MKPFEADNLEVYLLLLMLQIYNNGTKYILYCIPFWHIITIHDICLPNEGNFRNEKGIKKTLNYGISSRCLKRLLQKLSMQY